MTRPTDRGPASRRVARIGIAVVLIVGVGLQVSALVAHQQADRANQQARADEQQGSVVDAATVTARADLAQAHIEADTAARALDDLRAILLAAGTSEASIAADVATTKAALAALQAQIDASAAGVQTRQSQLDALRGCLVVGQRALDATASRPSGDLDADLGAASAACTATAGQALAP